MKRKHSVKMTSKLSTVRAYVDKQKNEDKITVDETGMQRTPCDDEIITRYLMLTASVLLMPSSRAAITRPSPELYCSLRVFDGAGSSSSNPQRGLRVTVRQCSTSYLNSSDFGVQGRIRTIFQNFRLSWMPVNSQVLCCVAAVKQKLIETLVQPSFDDRELIKTETSTQDS